MSDIDKEILEADLNAARAEADRLGISYSPNAKAESIRKKIKAKLAESDIEDEDIAEASDAVDNSTQLTYKTAPRLPNGELDVAKLPKMPVKRGNRTKLEYTPIAKDIIRKDLTRLIRVKITCFNPAKKEWKGEVFSFVNSVVGTVKKFVPYNCEAADSYHVPYCIYLMMKAKEFQAFSGKKVNGVEVKTPRQVREFALEVLTPLTQAELDALAKKQHKGSLED